MNAHTTEELQRLQDLPLDEKIQMTKRRIQQWYLAYGGQVYVSFSGGKDSTVLLHIVRQIFPEVPAVFVNTGLEYPEVVQHVKSVENLVILRPEMDFRTVIMQYGYPVWSKVQAENLCKLKSPKISEKYKRILLDGVFIGRDGNEKKSRFKIPEKLLNAPFKISNKCCDIMKKRPFKKYQRETGRMPILGTMADEPIIRRNAWLKNGCNAFESAAPKSTPMAFWTQQDVLHYIVKYGLKFRPFTGILCPLKNRSGSRLAIMIGCILKSLKQLGATELGACFVCMAHI